MVGSYLTEVSRPGRKLRRPVHTFQVRHQPWQIQPFLLAPVLPGETLHNLLFQTRAVTAPIKHPLIGWWLEHYFFYVKHRDLTERDEFVDMMVEIGWTIANVDTAAASVPNYFAGVGIDWTQKCLERVTEEYFRNDGEAWNTFLIDSMPAASIGQNSWLDSVMPAGDLDTPVEPIVTVGVDDSFTAGEIERMQREYWLNRQLQLTNQSYEEFLESYGVKTEKEEIHRPELIRFSKEWQYPSNTINPATGVPSSAVSWAVGERADKKRFFKEPGFIFGVTVARPKVYLQNQRGSAAWMMQSAISWLPAVLDADPRSSMVSMGQTMGPLATISDSGGYWADVKDLLVYGDQFLNFARTETDANIIGLPTAALNKRYAADADVTEIFSGATKTVAQDGIVNLSIASRYQDASPTVNAQRTV